MISSVIFLLTWLLHHKIISVLSWSFTPPQHPGVDVEGSTSDDKRFFFFKGSPSQWIINRQQIITKYLQIDTISSVTEWNNTVNDTHQGTAFSHIFQPLQNLRQTRVVRVHKPYRRRRWIRFLKVTKKNIKRHSYINTSDLFTCVWQG